MTLLILFALLLSPVFALAQSSSDGHAYHYVPQPPPTEGTLVIPDGHGGVRYATGQGGTDSYTARIIGEGLTEQFRRNKPQEPLYTAPPLTVPERGYNIFHNPYEDATR